MLQCHALISPCLISLQGPKTEMYYLEHGLLLMQSSLLLLHPSQRFASANLWTYVGNNQLQVGIEEIWTM
uniref:Uncharacterized protein n=1 Tax=Manihot esculenta TaxID=3983 RepID=A0A2C9U2T8_MANES